MQTCLCDKAERHVKHLGGSVLHRARQLVRKDDDKAKVECRNGYDDRDDGIGRLWFFFKRRDKGVDDRYHDGHKGDKVLEKAHDLIHRGIGIFDVRCL